MKNLLPCLSALLLLAACTKPDPLPPATEVGAHTFGCYVDGQPFVPSQEIGWVSPRIKPITVGISHILGGRYFQILATSKDGRGFFFFVKDATKVGRYKVNHDALPYTVDFYTPGYIQYVELGAGYVTNPDHVGWFNLTRCDTIRGIFSGTFELRAYNPVTKRSIDITDGRFDLDSKKN